MGRGVTGDHNNGQIGIFFPQAADCLEAAVIPPQAIVLSTNKVVTSARNSLCGPVIAIRDRNASVEITVDVGETLIARITDASYREMDLRLLLR